MINRLIILMVLLSLIPLAIAQQDAYATGSNITIIEECFVCDGCGEYCSASAECNITIKNPRKTVIVDNLLMTNQLSFHNYTIDSSLTNMSGTFEYSVSCFDGGNNGSTQKTFFVNPGGIEPTQSRTDALTRSIFFFFILGLVLLTGGFFIHRLPPVRWSLFILGAIAILVTINLIFATLQDEVVNPNIENLFDIITAASFYLYWMAAVMIFMIWTISIFTTIKDRVARRKAERFA